VRVRVRVGVCVLCARTCVRVRARVCVCILSLRSDKTSFSGLVLLFVLSCNDGMEASRKKLNEI